MRWRPRHCPSGSGSPLCCQHYLQFLKRQRCDKALQHPKSPSQLLISSFAFQRQLSCSLRQREQKLVQSISSQIQTSLDSFQHITKPKPQHFWFFLILYLNMGPCICQISISLNSIMLFTIFFIIASNTEAKILLSGIYHHFLWWWRISTMIWKQYGTGHNKSCSHIP